METLMNLKETVLTLRSEGKKARKYEEAAAHIERAVQVLDSTQEAVRLSDQGRQKIIEANRKLWVTCPRPECEGARHRRTHAHIKGAHRSIHIAPHRKAA